MITSISIPEPCSQQWQVMTPVGGGRHCESCCKTVIDFTKMTDSEIINYFATKSNTCGRFTSDQLPRINQSFIISEPRGKFWKYLGIAAFIAGLFSTVKADAQVQKSPFPRHHVKHLNIQKDTLTHSLRIASLDAKPIIVNEIKIDATIKPVELKDSAINIEQPLVATLVGGVQVDGNVVEDWRNSYMLWRVLFKY